MLGQCESKKAAKSWGHTFIAIQPAGLVDDFEGKAASILAAVKASGGNIRIPGENSAKTAAARQAEGTMPIPAASTPRLGDSNPRTSRSICRQESRQPLLLTRADVGTVWESICNTAEHGLPK